MMLTVGTKAPAFTALDQDGHVHSLSDYEGHWLLLYFYPKDETPGCTAEACAFRDHHDVLEELVNVVGVSADTVESHAKFAARHGLPFTLLADPEQAIIQAYGADGETFPKRVSFLIDPEGKIAKIYEKVDPAAHAQQVLRDMEDRV